MRVSITELRDMVAEAVRRTVKEAKKKPKLTAPRSEESIEAQRDRQLTGLPGYEHGQVLDMSKPLGKKNLAKRQGASGMGGWTSEGVEATPGLSLDKFPAAKISAALEDEGMPPEQIKRFFAKLVAGHRNPTVATGGDTGLDDPSELGIEQKHESIRTLVRLIVGEEIRVRRGR